MYVRYEVLQCDYEYFIVTCDAMYKFVYIVDVSVESAIIRVEGWRGHENPKLRHISTRLYSATAQIDSIIHSLN